MTVTIRPSPRARRMRLTASAERGIVLVVPARASQRTIDAFLVSQRAWIARQTERIAQLEHQAIGYARSGTAWIDGAPLPLELVSGARSRAMLRPNRVEVVAPDARGAALAVERLYRRLVRERVEQLIAASALADRVTGLTVGDQRTRWGSCSRGGTLSFSWRLVLAPPAVPDYVVVHELCHLVHHDHSRRFWSLVAEHRPAWRTQATWLKQHGWELHRHDPVAGGLTRTA